jgi:hypothetical protein
MRYRRLLDIVIAGMLVGAVALGLPGCGSGSGVRTRTPPTAGPGPLTGGDTPSDPDATDPPPDIEAILAANAEALRDLDSLSIDRRQPGRDPATEKDPALDTIAATIAEAPISIEREDVPRQRIEPTPTPTRQQRISKAVEELAMLLRAQAEQSDAPVSSMASLSALELLERGVSPDPATMPWLTDRERELLTVFRDLFRDAGERLASDPNDLLSVQEVIERLPERLRSWSRLSISVATLCVRVDGFGQYEEFGSNTLLAGRTHRMIVYTELADFRSESATGPGGRAGRRVRLTQDLSLYHDADGLLAWREADQTINEFSRNERSDFFLVQLIELPRTLTVGSYRLKVTIVDEVAGATAEAVIPIDVVADAGLAGR